ncbi:MAG: UbiA family prenyltransferase [Pseudomonadota bacterium]
MSKPVLVLDLDGTLIRNDLTFELFVLCARWNPILLIYIVFVALRDRAKAKHLLAGKYGRQIDVARLPFEPKVLELIEEHKRSGHEVALVSGSDESLVKSIAQHLSINAYKGSSPGTNLTSDRKAAYLTQTYGQNFLYVGNSTADFSVWRVAKSGFGVNAPNQAYQLKTPEGAIVPVEKLVDRQNEWIALFRGLRVHQWAKNSLLFVVPMIQITNLKSADYLSLFWAFLCFSLLASATYLLNDLFDIQDDRQHHSKRNRPLASGKLSVPLAVWVSALAIPAALFVAFTIGATFASALIAYLIVTVLYSFRIKRIAVADVFTLAGLFSIRVIAGGYVVGYPPSGWLLTFIGAFFLSLAIGKRFIEVHALEEATVVAGRGYVSSDAIPLLATGAATGTIAVLALLIYGLSAPITVFNSETVVLIASALLLSWVLRFWLLAGRGEITADPVEYAIKNRTSLSILGAISLTLMFDLTGPMWQSLF